MRVEERIAAYRQAVSEQDSETARLCLEALEGEAYRNEADWAVIRAFMQKEGLLGRLEIVTAGLIRQGGLTSGQPYSVLAGIYAKSNRIAQVKPLIEQYRGFKTDVSAKGWLEHTLELANVLFDARLYEDCLAEVGAILAVDPEHFSTLLLQAKTQWRLGEARLARKKLREMRRLLGKSPNRWHWFASLAFDFGDLDSAAQATGTLIKMIGRGEGKLHYNLVVMLKKQGYAEQFSKLVFIAEPQAYSGASELAYVFDLALECGARQTATRFGEAIRATASDKKLLAKVERYFAAPGFLMV